MTEWLIDWFKSMISGFDDSVNSVATILTEDIFKSGPGTLYSIAESVKGVVEPIALTIITICFLIEFIKITIKMDVLKWEYLLRVLFKFVFAKLCIEVSFQLLSAIYQTASEWIKGVSGVSSLGATTSSVLETQLKDIGLLKAVGMAITMCPAFLAIKIIGFIIKIIAYARMFELLVYLAVSPLPCAFLPMEDGGGSRIPKKFFLSFASVSIQGLFIMISIKLYTAICGTTLNAVIEGSGNASDVAYNMLMGALILAMAVIKSGSWASKILDAM